MIGQELQIVLEAPAFRDVLYGRFGHCETDIQESRMIRFANVIVRAGVEDLLEIIRPVVPGAGENVIKFPHRIFAQEPAEIQAVHPRKLNVQDDERVKCPTQQIARLLRRVAALNLMPAGPDHPLKKEPCRAVILDNKHLK